MSKKKRFDQRKPRQEHIYATTIGEVTELVLTVDSRTGDLRFEQPMTNIFSEVSYERAKGPKVLSRIPQQQSSITHNSDEALKRNYDVLFAVDTNTRKIGSDVVSITAAVQLTDIALPGPTQLQRFWKFDFPFCMALLNPKMPPENFGWLESIGHLFNRNVIHSGQRVGVIVDSDLGNLKHFNERSKPVCDNRLLPESVTLLYASSDSGQENISNKALKLADNVVGQVFAALGSNLPFTKKPSDATYFDGVAFITPNLIRTGIL